VEELARSVDDFVCGGEVASKRRNAPVLNADVAENMSDAVAAVPPRMILRNWAIKATPRKLLTRRTMLYSAGERLRQPDRLFRIGPPERSCDGLPR
jgi:hypothetical protein